jgi:hypothetical protein
MEDMRIAYGILGVKLKGTDTLGDIVVGDRILEYDIWSGFNWLMM